jgi:hypothetical protein
MKCQRKIRKRYEEDFDAGKGVGGWRHMKGCFVIMKSLNTRGQLPDQSETGQNQM